MRSTTVIALLLMLSPAALAQNNSEDTRDLPSPSMTTPAPTPKASQERSHEERSHEERSHEERNRAGRAPASTRCQAVWVCGRLRYPANDGYPPGSYVEKIQAGGRSVAGPCHKEKGC
jgi:hypothetical protein